MNITGAKQGGVGIHAQARTCTRIEPASDSEMNMSHAKAFAWQRDGPSDLNGPARSPLLEIDGRGAKPSGGALRPSNLNAWRRS